MACTGVHGANRLASNSLLEGLVYGARAGQDMREQLQRGEQTCCGRQPAGRRASGNGQPGEVEKFIQKVQSLMWQHVGVVREGKALQQVVPELRVCRSGRRRRAIAVQ